MAIQLHESFNYLPEMASETGEVDSEGFEESLVQRAFRALREVLPNNERQEKLSELEVLKLAMEYIHELEQILCYGNRNPCQ